MASRLFAVLAALFIVTAIALASLLPPQFQLDQLMQLIDRASFASFLLFARAHFPGWAMAWVIQPLLLRPCWLLPATAGLICAGAAASINSRPRATRTRRRRS